MAEESPQTHLLTVKLFNVLLVEPVSEYQYSRGDEQINFCHYSAKLDILVKDEPVLEARISIGYENDIFDSSAIDILFEDCMESSGRGFYTSFLLTQEGADFLRDAARKETILKIEYTKQDPTEEDLSSVELPTMESRDGRHTRQIIADREIIWRATNSRKPIKIEALA